MGWVTLDDGQHVYIGSSGRVLATRSQISSGPGGGKERGKALAARSKAAIGRATAQQSPATTRAIEHARAAGPTLREQAAASRARGITDPEQRHRIAQRQAEQLETIRKGRAQRVAMATPGSPQRQKIAATMKTLRSGSLPEAAKAYGGTVNKFASGSIGAGKGIAVKSQSGRWIVQSQKEAAHSYLKGVGQQVKRAVNSPAGRRARRSVLPA